MYRCVRDVFINMHAKRMYIYVYIPVRVLITCTATQLPYALEVGTHTLQVQLRLSESHARHCRSQERREMGHRRGPSQHRGLGFRVLTFFGFGASSPL